MDDIPEKERVAAAKKNTNPYYCINKEIYHRRCKEKKQKKHKTTKLQRPSRGEFSSFFLIQVFFIPVNFCLSLFIILILFYFSLVY